MLSFQAVAVEAVHTNNVGVNCLLAGNFQKAIRCFRQSLAAWRQVIDAMPQFCSGEAPANIYGGCEDHILYCPLRNGSSEDQCYFFFDSAITISPSIVSELNGSCLNEVVSIVSILTTMNIALAYYELSHELAHDLSSSAIQKSLRFYEIVLNMASYKEDKWSKLVCLVAMNNSLALSLVLAQTTVATEMRTQLRSLVEMYMPIAYDDEKLEEVLMLDEVMMNLVMLDETNMMRNLSAPCA